MSNLSLSAGDSRTSSTVLRNAYLLLALSMIPTALAAWFGMGSGFNEFSNAHPWIASASFLIVGIGLVVLICATRESLLGVVFLLLFAALEGIFLSPMLTHLLHNSVNGAQTLAVAAGGTGVVLVVMAIAASVTRSDLSGMGAWLSAGLAMLIVLTVANLFLGIHALELALGTVGCLVFAGYMLYDVNQAVQGGATNSIVVALNLYLDVINLFLSVLRLLGD